MRQLQYTAENTGLSLVYSHMYVAVYNTQRRFRVDPASVGPLIQFVLKAEGTDCDEVAIHFVGKKKICTLHAEFFNDPSPTDCITFPVDQTPSFGYRFLGEVFVCPEAALQHIDKKSPSFQPDLYTEISLYVVHGLLHLLGYDDQKRADVKIMREKENFHIQRLKAKGLLLRSLSDGI